MKFLKYFVLLFVIACHSPNNAIYNSTTKAPNSLYSADSLYLKKVAEYFMNHKIGSFRGIKRFNKYTVLYLDSIIYAPSLNKMVCWVITKDSAYKASFDKVSQTYTYDGFFMHAFRDSLTHTLIVSEDMGLSYSSVFSYKETHEYLKYYSFTDRKNFHSFGNTQDHTINDIRFWNEPKWNLMLKYPRWFIKDSILIKIEDHQYINGEWVKK